MRDDAQTKNLKLVKSAQFGDIQADIYSDNSEVFMTINQLAECLGYSDRSGVQKIVDRNPYLNSAEFTGWDNLSLPQGGTQKTRVFTEDGIYEVTMLSSQPKAKEFRAWIRGVLKDLRTGKAKLVSMTEYQRLAMETRQGNINVRKAHLLKSIADECRRPEYKQVLHSKITELLTGEALLPLPPAERKTLSAKEIGDRLGISSNMVGRIANMHGLKTPDYGQLFYDKARHADKQVESWRYYDNAIPVFERLLENHAGQAT